MLNSTQLIVLSSIRYKDNDLIVKAYSNKRGITSYLIRGVFKSKKGLSKKVYFQPLAQLLIEESYKPNRSLQSLREVKYNYIYQSIYTDIYKSAITFFLAEVLSASLKEEEANEELFHFLELSFQYLDSDDQFSNFHLLFMLRLTKYLGFYPDISKLNYPYFDLQKGTFELSNRSIYTISGQVLTHLKQLLGINFDALSSVKINAKQRQKFLNMLLHYFDLHLGDFKKPRSLQVLNDVFH
ncbi:MAG: DNA repair protein RecO [Bacteroidota bacterium]